MDYGSVLRALAAEMRELIPHDHMDVVILTSGAQEHRCFEVGPYTIWSELGTTPKPTVVSPIRSVLWGRQPYLLSHDAEADTRFHFEGALDAPIFTAGLRSRIVVPLRVQAKIVGALNISRHARGCYCEDQVAVAQQCAALIAPYFYALTRADEARDAAMAEGAARAREQMLRIGALRLTEGMERERQRIAMDLHDQTLADLARLSRKLAHLRLKGRAGVSELIVIEEEILRCLQELRGVVEDMKPGMLTLFGFCDAVEAHIARAISGDQRQVTGRIIDHSDNAPDRLPDTTRIALYRIVQEAVNNAARHSSAENMVVEIVANGDDIAISVRDDGVGFDVSAMKCHGGGMSHMRTRADLIGARLVVHSGADRKGTEIRVTLGGKRRRLANAERLDITQTANSQ
jgi:signal transduction histidine kinase